MKAKALTKQIEMIVRSGVIGTGTNESVLPQQCLKLEVVDRDGRIDFIIDRYVSIFRTKL